VPTILAIDDGRIGLKARQKLLESAGYTVLAASDAVQGGRLFEDYAVDLVLMDYYLPEGGSQLRRRMKARRPQVPIVILSGIPELPEDMSNVDVFLSKLDPPTAILQRIAELLRFPSRRAA
jgi:CheY-like chemotaxis protein